MSPPSQQPNLAIEPYSFILSQRFEQELGVSRTVAQILARRGYDDIAEVERWLAADYAYDPYRFVGMDRAVDLICVHLKRGSRIMIHGDYDVDGVCSTAILVRQLRELGGNVGWLIPSRTDDGYGLSQSTVEKLVAAGTELLITADCAITAVEEVALAKQAGIDVVVTDHHMARADGALPDAPIVHPALCDYPCPHLCAAGVVYKLVTALLMALDKDPGLADGELDLVAMATVADLVPLIDENRRLLKAGLKTLAATDRLGLRALMRVSRVDPSGIDEQSIAFRLAPRINAAGRLYRADAGVELLLTTDATRAEQIAEELESNNVERRHTETRILFAAEARLKEMGERMAYVLAGEGWHPGVIGIVASRLVERYNRPVIMLGIDGAEATGSGRSIANFDLLAGMTAGKEHLGRYGGHRAACGLQLAADKIDAFREAFELYASEHLTSDDLISTERVDAIVSGPELNLDLAQELAKLGPFGKGNPPINLLCVGANLTDARSIGEGNKHLRFTLNAGGVRCGGVAFGVGEKLPVPEEIPADTSFSLSRNEWKGVVEAQITLRSARQSSPLAIDLLGEASTFDQSLLEELARPNGGSELDHDLSDLAASSHEEVGRSIDRRGVGVIATLADLVSTGESVLVVCADANQRLKALGDRVGGFALCAHLALERQPDLLASFQHIVALDPPAHSWQFELLTHSGGSYRHLLWGEKELAYAKKVNEREWSLRPALVSLYRSLREETLWQSERLLSVLKDCSGESGRLAARLLTVLSELELIVFDPPQFTVTVNPTAKVNLENSHTWQLCQKRFQDGVNFFELTLTEAIQRSQLILQDADLATSV